jgi:plastocyanin
MSMVRRLVLAAVLATAAVARPAAAATYTVTIEGMKFVPERIEVAVGDSITWINRDIVPHSVTAKAARIESGDLGSDQRWTFKARRQGEIDYACRLHPVMHGMLVVK